MRRIGTSYMRSIYDKCDPAPDSAAHSDKAPLADLPEIPDFVSACVAARVPLAQAEILNRRVLEVGQAIREKRMTPDEGVELVEAMCGVVFMAVREGYVS